MPSATELARWLGADAVALGPVTNGHTNDSSFVTAGDARFVLRRSWRGKPAAQLACEAALLDGLRSSSSLSLSIPRIVPTRGGERQVVDDEGRVLQLFARCAGAIGPRWLRADDVARVRAAMTRLAELHAALSSLPLPSDAVEVVADGHAPRGVHEPRGIREPRGMCAPNDARAVGDPLHWLRARYDRVRALAAHATTAPADRAPMPAGADEVLARIDAILGRSPPRPLQWLHGDYHLGNLLWHDDETRVAAVVDFDDCDRGHAASEAALALFALARRQDAEDDFAFHRPLWDAGLTAYRDIAGPIAPYDDVAATLPLFCAYQVLIHLEALLRRHWSPAPGIGFWPCWNRLRAPSP